MPNLVWVRDQWANEQDEMTFRHVKDHGFEVYAGGTKPNVSFTETPYLQYHSPLEVLQFADIVDLPGFEYIFAYPFVGIHDNVFMSCFDNIPFGKAGRAPGEYYDKIRHVIARTNMIKRCLIVDGVPEDKITVVPSGVDTDLFRPTSHSLMDKNVLFIGRGVPEKGLYDLILAMSGINAQLIVAGPENIDPYFELAKKARVSINHLGPVLHKEIPSLMEACSVFVLPSFPSFSFDPSSAWIEQFGVVLIEAKASGVPVVATDIGSIPDIVRHGIDGYLVPARSWDKMHDAILTILENKDLALKFGEEGRKDALRRFSSRVVGEKLADVYGRYYEPRS